MNTFYEFETFHVDEEKRLLWENGKILSIKPKTFDTLLALLKNKNEIISKDDLIEEIWHGDAVSDDSLTQQISQLRKLLGDSADEHKFIVTIPGIGYKFVADVQEIQSLDGVRNSIGYLEKKRDFPQNDEIDFYLKSPTFDEANLQIKELTKRKNLQDKIG